MNAASRRSAWRQPTVSLPSVVTLVVVFIIIAIGGASAGVPVAPLGSGADPKIAVVSDQELPQLSGNRVAIVCEVENSSAIIKIDHSRICNAIAQVIRSGRPTAKDSTPLPVITAEKADLVTNQDSVVLFLKLRAADLDFGDGQLTPTISYSYVLGVYSFGSDALIGSSFRRISIPRTISVSQETQIRESQISTEMERSLTKVISDLKDVNPHPRPMAP